MNKKLLTSTIHIAAWACFFLLPVVFYPRPKDPSVQLSNTVTWMFTTMNIFLVIFYYSNTQLLIPKLLANKKWLWYAVAIIALLVIYSMIPKLFEDAIRAELPERIRDRSRRRPSVRFPFNGSTAVFFLVFTVSTCVKVIQQWLSAEKRNREIENEKLATELSFLKSQINPHFLFNTLNNIYSLAIVKSDATAPAVMKLSSIMRYVLTETKQQYVSLDNEITFIQHYIELQKVRLTDKVTINFNVEGDTANEQIAPLILIPFVENAFKYGISTKEKGEIIMRLQVKNKTIHFYIDNPIISSEVDKGDNTSIGLVNTRRRLELLYPEKHELKVHKENRHFIVDLTLNK